MYIMYVYTETYIDKDIYISCYLFTCIYKILIRVHFSFLLYFHSLECLCKTIILRCRWVRWIRPMKIHFRGDAVTLKFLEAKTKMCHVKSAKGCA